MTNEHPLISVIVPVYNVEKYLRRCLDSIVNQTYKNLEIILVDDGSVDNSGNICDEYAVKDKRIQVIHKENGGLSSARNKGLDIINGEYVSFIDSDDYVDNSFIEKLYTICINNNVDIAQCDFSEFGANGCDLQNDVIKNNKYTQNELQEKIYTKTGYKSIVVWNKLYKCYIYRDLRFPFGKVHEDEFTTYKAFFVCKTPIVITNEKLYYYRVNPDSIMRKKFNLNRLDVLEAFEERINFFKEKKQENLSYLALIGYSSILKEMYQKVKENIEEPAMYLSAIKEKVRSTYKEIKKTDINRKGKKEREKELLKTLIFLSSPSIYFFLKKIINSAN